MAMTHDEIKGVLKKVLKLVKENTELAEDVKRLQDFHLHYLIKLTQVNLLKEKVLMWETFYKNMNTRMMN